MPNVSIQNYLASPSVINDRYKAVITPLYNEIDKNHIRRYRFLWSSYPLDSQTSPTTKITKIMIHDDIVSSHLSFIQVTSTLDLSSPAPTEFDFRTTVY